MFTARRSVLAVAVLFAASFCTPPAFSQSAHFLNAEARSLHLLSPSLSSHPCSINSTRSLAALPGEAFPNDTLLSPCDDSLSRTSAPLPIAPCNRSAQAAIPCSASRDAVRDDLNTLGKQGHTILRARDKVLEILQSENACSAWYRTKDPDPAATFRTLTFSLDRNGEYYVRKFPEPGGFEVIRNPYVASVTQDGGPDSTITINLNGAFFFPTATVVQGVLDGGPVEYKGARSIQVGPYAGGSFRAQVVALLHEFGHVIDLLPQDQGDYEGRSRQNTLEVLRVCRAEVESKEAPRSLLASR
jgi:hypothetical protein